MIGLNAIFWMFVILFGIIGAMRGWAKELLVTFAVILSLFIMNVLENLVPVIGPALRENPATEYWVRTILLSALVFFGYQSPSIPRLASTNRFVREKLQDSLLGFILGGINAYLFVGSLLWYLQQAYGAMNNTYPLSFILPPDPNSSIGMAYYDLVKRLPPAWLSGVSIYVAVAIAFAFVLIVFI
jgi:uncharacterized membrane protein required for colicin V production